jgi:hypothetical protein
MRITPSKGGLRSQFREVARFFAPSSRKIWEQGMRWIGQRNRLRRAWCLHVVVQADELVLEIHLVSTQRESLAVGSPARLERRIMATRRWGGAASRIRSSSSTVSILRMGRSRSSLKCFSAAEGFSGIYFRMTPRSKTHFRHSSSRLTVAPFMVRNRVLAPLTSASSRSPWYPAGYTR